MPGMLEWGCACLIPITTHHKPQDAFHPKLGGWIPEATFRARVRSVMAIRGYPTCGADCNLRPVAPVRGENT